MPTSPQRTRPPQPASGTERDPMPASVELWSTRLGAELRRTRQNVECKPEEYINECRRLPGSSRRPVGRVESPPD